MTDTHDPLVRTNVMLRKSALGLLRKLAEVDERSLSWLLRQIVDHHLDHEIKFCLPPSVEEK